MAKKTEIPAETAAPAMTTINVALLKAMRPDLDAALAEIGKKHGVKFKAGNASCNPSAGTGQFKLEIVACAADGSVRDVDADMFLQFATLIGMAKEDLGKAVMVQGKPFTIAGYNPKATKNSIVIKSPTGSRFVTDVDTAKRALARAAKA